MYESFFGFKRRPFPVAPSTELYFPAAAIEQARETLSRLVERAEGPGLVIGSAGTGKSLLCQVLAEQFQNRFQVAQLASAQLCTRRALLQALLYSLGLPYRERAEGELRLALIDHLNTQEILGDAVLLIIDEAHSLPLRLLEELRMITNLARNGEPRVRLVLVGSHQLEERLSSPKLESFSQRLAARCYLTAFESAETQQYVRAQIAAARGNEKPLFTDAAQVAIHRATDGVPRLVNQLSDHALVLAFAGGSKKNIDEPGIAEAWADLQQLPLPQSMNISAHREPRVHELVEFGELDDLDIAGAEQQDSGEYESSEWSTEDDHAEAIPFPLRAARHFEPERQVERISHQLEGLEDDFSPIGSIGPEIELVFQDPLNPFGDGFLEEEVVFDRYASLDESYLRGRPRVFSRTADRPPEMAASSVRQDREERKPAPLRTDAPAASRGNNHGGEGHQLPAAKRAKPFPDGYDPVFPEEDANRLSPAAGSPRPEFEQDDRDMIIVEDEPLANPRVRRQEYRQLFAKLRRSS
jgi:type II secretory pathway predicted ATPase ExeA